MVGHYPTNKLIGRNPLPQQQPKPPFTLPVMPQERPFGITHRFQRLFQSEGYVDYVLLTLSPLYLSEDFRARLACLIHTASVRSEPGSNPSVELIWLCDLDIRTPGTQPIPKETASPRRAHIRSHSNSRVTLFSKNCPRRGSAPHAPRHAAPPQRRTRRACGTSWHEATTR